MATHHVLCRELCSLLWTMNANEPTTSNVAAMPPTTANTGQERTSSTPRPPANEVVSPKSALMSMPSTMKLMQLAANGPKSEREQTLIQKLIREHNTMAEREELRKRLAPKIDILIQESNASDVLNLLAEMDSDAGVLATDRVLAADVGSNSIPVKIPDESAIEPPTTRIKQERVSPEPFALPETPPAPTILTLPKSTPPAQLPTALPKPILPPPPQVPTEKMNLDYSMASNRLLDLTLECEGIKGQIQVLDSQIAKCLDMRIRLLMRQQTIDAERLSLVAIPNMPIVGGVQQQQQLNINAASPLPIDFASFEKYILPNTPAKKRKSASAKPRKARNILPKTAIKKKSARPAAAKKKKTNAASRTPEKAKTMIAKETKSVSLKTTDLAPTTSPMASTSAVISPPVTEVVDRQVVPAPDSNTSVPSNFSFTCTPKSMTSLLRKHVCDREDVEILQVRTVTAAKSAQISNFMFRLPEASTSSEPMTVTTVIGSVATSVSQTNVFGVKVLSPQSVSSLLPTPVMTPQPVNGALTTSSVTPSHTNQPSLNKQSESTVTTTATSTTSSDSKNNIFGIKLFEPQSVSPPLLGLVPTSVMTLQPVNGALATSSTPPRPAHQASSDKQSEDTATTAAASITASPSVSPNNTFGVKMFAPESVSPPPTPLLGLLPTVSATSSIPSRCAHLASNDKQCAGNGKRKNAHVSFATENNGDKRPKVAEQLSPDHICLHGEALRVHFYGHTNSINILRVHNDNVFSCSSDGTVKRYSPLKEARFRDGRHQLIYNLHYKHNFISICGLEIFTTKQDSYVIICTRDGTLKKFQNNSKFALRTVETQVKITCMTIRWNKVYAGTNGGKIMRFCALRLQYEAALPCSDHPVTCLGTAVEGACRILVGGSLGGDVNIRDAFSGLFNRWLKLRPNRYPTALVVVQDRVFTRAAIKEANYEIYVHNVENGNLLHVVEDVSGITSYFVSAVDPNSVYFTAKNGYVYKYQCDGGQPLKLVCGLIRGDPSALYLHKNMIILGSHQGQLEALIYKDKCCCKPETRVSSKFGFSSVKNQ